MTLFIIAFILGAIVSQAAPDYSGSWTGYITQKSTVALSSNYQFSIFLIINGNEISGHSEIRMWDEPDVFAEMNLEGTFDDHTVQLTETEITKQKIYSYAYWCLKVLKMTYSMEDGKEFLKGGWFSDVCSGPGEIYLERTPAT